jgi:heme-degrading monooxygenase HmoA
MASAPTGGEGGVMATAGVFAPDQETASYGARTVPDRRLTPGMVGGLAGPANAGPEQVGALSLVYGSFADCSSAQQGFRAFAEAQRSLLAAPGFLRWLSFADGPHGYGLGWWRSADDATAWARSRIHRDFVSAQRRAPFELSQFAGIWTAHHTGSRAYFCPRCRSRVVATAGACDCGEPLDDGFAPTPG